MPVLTPITSPISLKLIGVCSNDSIVYRCSLVKCLYPILCRFSGYVSKVILSRFKALHFRVEPSELGEPAVFLASHASDAVNGHILYVDGGILAYIGKQPK